MPESLQSFKGRIEALEKTASITSALSKISSSKVSLTLKELQKFENFQVTLESVFLDVLQQHKGHSLLTRQGEKRLFILISSDKGLVGGYHNNLFKSFSEEIKDLDKNDYLVLTIGKKGYYFAKKHQLPLITDRIISNYDDITTYSFKEEIKTVLETYLTNLFSCVEIHYMHYENAISQNPKRLVILPIELEVEEEYAPQYNYDQNVSVVLEQMAIMYIETKIFGALLNAKMSEHASRLVAMKNATDNASEISAKLNLIYHRLRQQEITNELIDIVNASS